VRRCLLPSRSRRRRVCHVAPSPHRPAPVSAIAHAAVTSIGHCIPIPPCTWSMLSRQSLQARWRGLCAAGTPRTGSNVRNAPHVYSDIDLLSRSGQRTRLRKRSGTNCTATPRGISRAYRARRTQKFAAATSRRRALESRGSRMCPEAEQLPGAPVLCGADLRSGVVIHRQFASDR